VTAAPGAAAFAKSGGAPAHGRFRNSFVRTMSGPNRWSAVHAAASNFFPYLNTLLVKLWCEEELPSGVPRSSPRCPAHARGASPYLMILPTLSSQPASGSNRP
jgi:hypothetical protein